MSTSSERTYRPLTIPGAWTTAPAVYHDDRGFFLSTYVDTEHLAFAGEPLFPVRQLSFSRSRRGVVRGIHFSRARGGVEKYVYCSQGAVLDYVVDLRVGSPTFGQWDSVRLDEATGQAVYLPAGVGHAFAALTDNACMTYLLSSAYVASNELAVSITDPRIGLRLPALPDGMASPPLSPRDAAAPTLAEAEAEGLLPYFEACAPNDRRRTDDHPSVGLSQRVRPGAGRHP